MFKSLKNLGNSLKFFFKRNIDAVADGIDSNYLIERATDELENNQEAFSKNVTNLASFKVKIEEYTEQKNMIEKENEKLKKRYEKELQNIKGEDDVDNITIASKTKSIISANTERISLLDKTINEMNNNLEKYKTSLKIAKNKLLTKSVELENYKTRKELIDFQKQFVNVTTMSLNNGNDSCKYFEKLKRSVKVDETMETLKNEIGDPSVNGVSVEEAEMESIYNMEDVLNDYKKMKSTPNE